ncbi:hypothetical protein L5515_015751 [Caenorhabditis briggsae]|uniref:Potassium channel tetramerisation-type BTB domain-containing protein n=1 Tax=Caenorhabditis briggsae TaxID=6238 RepID=A0AAE9EI44_CAEBR|nr:hypothetical protein L5515_015751 [Caenorhabditis briggsae]
MAHIIKLNVGGSLFQTSKSTLIKFDGFFKTMLETEIPVVKDESGAIFIDRDPKYFLELTSGIVIMNILSKLSCSTEIKSIFVSENKR